MRDSVRRLAACLRFAFGASPATALGTVLCAVTLGIAPVLVVWTTGNTVNAISQQKPLSAVVGVLVVMLAAMAWVGLLPAWEGLVQADLARAVQLKAQERSFQRVNADAGLGDFESPVFHDQLRLAISAGSETPTQVVNTLTSVVRGVITLAGFAVTLLLIDPLAAVLVLLAGVPRVVAESRLGQARFNLLAFLSPTERLAGMYAGLQTDPAAAKEIRLFGLGSHLMGRLRSEMKVAHTATRKLEVRTAKSASLLEVVSLLPVAVCLLLVTYRASQGALDPGSVVILLGALSAADGAVVAVASGLARLSEISLSVTRFDDLVKRPVRIERHRGKTVDRINSLEFVDVWFRYRPDLPWVLNGVTFTIEHGTSIGVVGANGAGKSTMIKLLSRFYDPDQGTILVNGEDIRLYDVDSLRSRMGTVFQDFMTYDMTIRDNVALGDIARTVADDEIWSALDSVGLSQPVREMPHGLNTMVSRYFIASDSEMIISDGDMAAGIGSESVAEGQTFLSGGQLQRLAIARMLLRSDRDLLVLDEPMSGLDPQAESDLTAVVRSKSAGRTRVLISHRLNTLRDADTILVLSDGKIAEQGSHDDLVRLGGIYRHLFSLQSRGFADSQAEDHALHPDSVACPSGDSKLIKEGVVSTS